MNANRIVIIVTIAIVIIGAIVCDLVRRKKYKPSAQLNELKQPLSLDRTTHGNYIATYTNIKQMLPQLLRDIECAKEYVLFQFFKFENDSLGKEVQEALINKVTDGVPVYIIYDAFPGAIVDHSFFHEMRLYGIEVHRYNPIFPIPTAYSNNRNHRKIVVIDGQIGYIGGMNIAQRYLTGVHDGDWRDTHLRITGTACQHLRQVFLDDWRKQSSATDIVLPACDSNQSTSEAIQHPTAEGGLTSDNSTIQIIASDPQDSQSPILHAMIQMVDAAQHYLYIQSPYFLPPKALQHALCQAAERGVDVRLMIPQRGDRSIFVPYASRSYLKPLLDAGVKVFFHTSGFIHAKMIVADSKVATLGSTNIDFRSFTQNSECNAFVYDETFARQMQKVFIDDMHQCHMLPQDWWQHRSIKERILQVLVKPFVFIM